MTVIVTKMAGGITQLFNTKTGKVTYKCKADSAFMLSEPFGGIVKFSQKGAMAIVTGDAKTLDSCEIIKLNDEGYKEALSKIIEAKKTFVNGKLENAQKEIQELENQLSSL